MTILVTVAMVTSEKRENLHVTLKTKGDGLWWPRYSSVTLVSENYSIGKISVSNWHKNEHIKIAYELTCHGVGGQRMQCRSLDVFERNLNIQVQITIQYRCSILVPQA